jgi:nucleoside-diphosphate-sugar epimerase
MGIDLNGARIFVTGGAGFIGSFIVDQVLEAGAEHVRIVDDFVRGRQENLEDAVATGRVEVTEGDIRDAALVDRLTDGCDLVFHQAALRITQSAEEPVRAIQVMINGTQNVLEAAVKHGVKKIAAASTASVYGDPSYLPMDENTRSTTAPSTAPPRSPTSRSCAPTTTCTASSTSGSGRSTSTVPGWTSSAPTPR